MPFNTLLSWKIFIIATLMITHYFFFFFFFLKFTFSHTQIGLEHPFSHAHNQPQTHSRSHTHTKKKNTFKTITTKPLNHCQNVTTLRGKHAHEWVCKQIARRLTGASFYHRESTQTTQWFRPKLKDWATIRSDACETHRRERPPFRWKMDEWCWQLVRPPNIIRVMRLHYKDTAVGTVNTRDTHACSTVDL